jgi:hypothetical protein|tara:strand:- start:351 stop:500 length:150 start_codon:yes stop_codon:yes gene_type:complete
MINFLDDEEKMYDFERLTKEEFLFSYSYLSEEEYNLTRIAQKVLTERKK